MATKKPAPAPSAPAQRPRPAAAPTPPARGKPAPAAPPRPAQANAVATRPQGGGLPAALRDRAKKDAGRGLSGAMDDNLIPLVYFLQSNSASVSRGNPAAIEGAKPGDLLLRGADNPIIDGDEGAEFQPCYFGKEWLEWLPDRGGFAGRHDKRPADARQVENPQRKGRMIWRTKSGNDLTESRFYAGFIRPMGDPEARWLPYILPFKGTGHTAARDLMSQANNKFDAGGSSPDPIWLHRYQITTFWRQNDAGEFYVPQIGYLGPISSDDEYDRGERTNAAFASGALKAAVDVDDEPAGGGAPSGEDAEGNL